VSDLHHGDCLDVMRGMAESSIDAIVCDPPYGLSFMGKTWDKFQASDMPMRGRPELDAVNAGMSRQGGRQRASADYQKRQARDMREFQAWCESWAIECLRVLKPGGYMLAFGGTRTYHRLVTGVEDAGFEIRDQIGWAFGSGLPKSHNGEWGGTALKPAWEPICMARKPLIGTVEANWQEHGTGALNINGCRVQTSDDLNGGAYAESRQESNSPWAASGSLHKATGDAFVQPVGRWPANLIHDGSDEVVSQFPRDAGAAAPVTVRNADKFRGTYGAFKGNIDEGGSTFRGDSGSAARFFYCAKADRADRNDGVQDPGPRLEHGATLRDAENLPKAGNHHPTVKPTDLRRYLCRLVTPAGGLILDPFMGSGSTGRGAVLEGFRFVGIEREADYMEIARLRIDSARRQGHQTSLNLEAA
jgi:DNA modification methylase